MNTTYSNTLSFKDYMSRTYLMVALGLLVSTLVAFLMTTSYTLLYMVARSSLFICLIELGIAIYFSARLQQMKKSTAYICYFLYSFVTGLTLGIVILSYTSASVVMALATTTVLFVCMAIIGKTTNVDFTQFSSLISTGLITIMIISLLNALLFHSRTTDVLISYVMVIIFLVLIAMDTQQLRRFYDLSNYNDDLRERMMIMGAFQLYLDFINLFLRVLQIFGRRDDRRSL